MARITKISTRKKEGITWMSSEAKSAIDDMEILGLCMARFKADMETSGLDYQRLSKGDQLSAGDMSLLITRVGKGCHATECPVFRSNKPCLMMTEVLFGEIIKEGLVTIGDEVVIKKG